MGKHLEYINEAFEIWWKTEGSNLSEIPELQKPLCKIAWTNGAYKASEAIEKFLEEDNTMFP